MEWSKLKNIILWILLLVNLFLLIMTGVQKQGSAQSQEQALADAVAVLERNGIRFRPERFPEQLKIRSMSMQRDREQETQLAQALLGACAVSDLGGGRYSYESGIGSAEFRSGGNFSIVFSDGIPITGGVGHEQEHAVEITGKLGLNGVGAERSREEDGTVSVVLYQAWKGIPVYSCRIVLQYRGGELYAISGQRLMSEPQPAASEETLVSVPTALMRVLNGVTDMGDVCSEIVAMTPGYQMTNPAEGTKMNPVWYVVTDTGAYELNAVTGKLERA